MRTTATTSIRCDVPVFYATTEGQSKRIAERLVGVLREHELTSEAIDIASQDAASIDWTAVRGAIVGASLHMQRHQRRAYRFVGAHVDDLSRVPSAFFSVSLSAASANPEERGAAVRLAEAFPDCQGWRPAMIVSFAGRLAYTQYGFFTKRVMQRIARKEGAPVDTSRDYELTNWEKVDRLARALVGLIHEHAAKPQIVAA
jgi:menaquinone-dependent protoporphyrinogen oxidase